jgi:hypothetical protein
MGKEARPLTGDDVERRWRTMQLVAPVFQLLERAAPRAELDHERETDRPVRPDVRSTAN